MLGMHELDFVSSLDVNSLDLLTIKYILIRLVPLVNPVVPGAWLPKLKQKKAAAEEAVKTSEKEATKTSEKAHSAEKAAEKEAISDEEIGNVAEKEVSEEETKNINDNNKDSYECPICEFSSTWEKGLEVHIWGRSTKILSKRKDFVVSSFIRSSLIQKD